MKKYLLLLLLIATVSVAFGQNNSKIAPELQGYTGTQQIHVMVQYAPGTQVNCSGLLGLVDCLVNDIVSLGGQLLAPLATGEWRACGVGRLCDLHPLEQPQCGVHQLGSSPQSDAEQRRTGRQCTPMLGSPVTPGRASESP